ncbi:hypothetical protein IB270_30030 [Ensifer sp. ENS05]|uniref:hypothetical protein n=1 Tax=Ensifer sp. ENS05 TaxID=2769277 RepID=UPI00177C95DD|nr:hypothetical protein [Ensifer sp. ENS05]MBD9597077.1 hypothetical protein [Ensifer sp. ENS05]
MLSTNTLTAGQHLDAIIVRVLKERIAVAMANARRPVEAPHKLVDHLLDQHRLSLHVLTAASPRREALLRIVDRPVFRKYFRRLHCIVAGIIENGIRDGHFKAQDHRLSAELFTAQTNPIWDPIAIVARLQGSECHIPYEHSQTAVDLLN